MRGRERRAGEESKDRRFGKRSLGAAACVALASIGSSCNLDPVHQSGIETLGPENPDLYPVESEYHRPGEPCALCHSQKGPASTSFALGGTIFWGPQDYNERVANAYVRILDGKKTQRCFVTNCNGNFYVTKADFDDLTFPILVSVERTKQPGVDESTRVIRRMSGHIGREPSCAICHNQGLRDYASPGQIRLFNEPNEFKALNMPLVTCPPPPDYVQIQACPEDRD